MGYAASYITNLVVFAYLSAEAVQLCASLYFIQKARLALPPAERKRLDRVLWY